MTIRMVQDQQGVQDEDLAEDVVQEFFIDYWEKQRNQSLKTTFQAYAVRAVKNQSISKLRTLHTDDKRLNKFATETYSDQSTEETTEVDQEALQLEVLRLIDRLPTERKKSHMKRPFCMTCLILLLNVLTCAVFAQKPRVRPNARIGRVENYLAAGIVYSPDSMVHSANIFQRMKELNVKGVSIAVIKNYQIDWAKAYGWADENEQRKADTHTLFQAASVSKTMNSMGLLKLVQQGKLNLDTDVNRYLKTWKINYDGQGAGSTVTLRALLSHSAGMGVSGFSGYERGLPLPRNDQILDGLPPANSAAVRFMAKPGTKFEYSGGGVVISQLVLTDVTGESYDSFMSREVFKPLGMNDSRYVLQDTSNVASGYYSNGEPVKGKYHVYPEQAAAGLWTTPGDLARYMIDCQLSLQGKSQKVLSTAFMRERFKPVVMYNESKVALGLFLRYINGTFYFNHNGGNEGFTCATYGSLKDGYGVVVMTNSNNSQLMQEVCNSVARVYGWDRFYVPTIIRSIEPAKEMLNRLVGNYADQASGIGLQLYDGQLYLQPDTTLAAKYRIYFLSRTSFVVPDYSKRSVYDIRLDENGKKITIESSSGNRVIRATKVW